MYFFLSAGLPPKPSPPNEGSEDAQTSPRFPPRKPMINPQPPSTATHQKPPPAPKPRPSHDKVIPSIATKPKPVLPKPTNDQFRPVDLADELRKRNQRKKYLEPWYKHTQGASSSRELSHPDQVKQKSPEELDPPPPPPSLPPYTALIPSPCLPSETYFDLQDNGEQPAPPGEALETYEIMGEGLPAPPQQYEPVDSVHMEQDSLIYDQVKPDEEDIAQYVEPAGNALPF